MLCRCEIVSSVETQSFRLQVFETEIVPVSSWKKVSFLELKSMSITHIFIYRQRLFSMTFASFGIKGMVEFLLLSQLSFGVSTNLI